MKIIYYILFVCTVSVGSLDGQIPKSTERYNKTFRRTEYFNAEGRITSYSKVNTKDSTVAFYDMAGQLLRTEALKADTAVTTLKKEPRKLQLSDEELAHIPEWRYHIINGKKLIQELNSDMENIGYYNLDGKLEMIKTYNRGTEEWTMDWLEDKSNNIK